MRIKTKSFFIRLVCIYFLILFIPCTILGVFTFYSAKEQEQIKHQQLITSHVDYLVEKIDTTIVSYTTFMENLTTARWLQATYSTSEHLSVFNNYSTLRMTYDNLAFLSTSFEFAKEVCIYLPEQHRIITSSTWWDETQYMQAMNITDDEKNFFETVTNSNYSQYILIQDQENNSHDSMVIVQAADLNVNPRAYFLVFVSNDRLNYFIDNIKYDFVHNVELMDGGETLYQFNKTDTDSVKTQSITRHSSIYGWEYVITVDDTQNTSNTTLWFSMALLIVLTMIGLFAVYISAKFTYKPLEKILQNFNLMPVYKFQEISEFQVIQKTMETMYDTNDQLMKSVESYYEGAKNTFLINLLSGSFDAEAEQEFVLYKIEFTNMHYYQVIIFRNIAPVHKLKSYLLIKCFLEEKQVLFEVASTIENDIVVIVRHKKPVPTQKFIKQLNSLAGQLNALEATSSPSEMLIGEAYQGIIGISTSYQNLKQKQLYYLNNQLNMDANIMVYYPTDWEIQLINNLKFQNQIKPLEILAQIKLENEKTNLSTAQQKKLIGLVLDTITRVADEMNYMSDSFMEIIDTIYEEEYNAQWMLLADLIQLLLSSEDQIKQPQKRAFTILLKEYVDQNYSDPNLSLKSIQQEFNVPISTVFRTFKKISGLSFYDYLCKLRIEKAKDMIQDGQTDSKLITHAVGYDNLQTFYRVFKKYTGISFKDYKGMLK